MIVAYLLPILIGHGAGSEVMSGVTAPMKSGMLTAPLLSMFVLPAAFLMPPRHQFETTAVFGDKMAQTNERVVSLTDIDWDNLPPTTLPRHTNVAIQGFSNEEAAKKLGQAVLEALDVIGSFIDLGTLDGVTIGIDYDAALASVNRGIEGMRPLSRSNTTEMQGVAMSPAVMRDGRVLTHLVFNAEMIAALIVDDAPQDDKSMAIGIIAHEAAHVQITAQKERAIPDARFGTRIDGFERAVMFQIAEICWDEYAACRLSALFAKGQNETHAETLDGTVRPARDRADEAIKSYRVHHDIERLVGEAGSHLCSPIKAAAYLLGGMDAVGADWDDFPEVRAAIVDADYGELIDELHTILSELWDTQDGWAPELATFGPLEALAKQVFDSGGIFFKTNDEGGCRVEVPFTPWTMPAG
jgi:hypothetical protein